MGDRTIGAATKTSANEIGSRTAKEHLRLSILILAMVLIAALSSAGSFWMLYRAAFEQQRVRLVETVQSQARLIEAIAESERIHGVAEHSDNEILAILSHVFDIYERFRGSGKTGEIILSHREGDNVVLTLSSRDYPDGDRDQVPSDSVSAEPFDPAYRSLTGQSGIMIGPDYRGVMVLAAYEPVAELNLGIVAKIDLAEVRAPFVRAGMLIASGLSFFLVLAVATVYRLGAPLVAGAQAAAALRASEARLAGILDIAAEAVIVVDARQHIQLFNQGAERIFGYTAEEVMGQPLNTLIPDRFRHAHTKDVNRFGTKPERKRLHSNRDTIYGLRKDGTEFPAEASISKLQVNGEKMFTVMLTDITQRVDAERKLREAHDQLERRVQERTAELREVRDDLARLIDHANAPIVAVDERGHISEWNRKIADITGYDKESMLGRHALDLIGKIVAESHRAAVMAALDRALAGEEIDKFEFPIDTACGTRAQLLFNATARRDAAGNIVGAIGVGQDITERKQAEDALKTSEERLRLAVRAGNVGLWDRNLTTNRAHFSPEWKSQIGYEEQELKDGNFEWHSLVHPDDRGAAQEKRQAYLENRVSEYKDELRFRHKDGSYRWILVEGAKVEDAATGEARLLGSHIDITERKQAEEALRLSEAKLAQAQELGGLGSWEFDMASKKDMWSATLYRLLGLDPAMPAPTLPEFLELVHREDRARVQEAHSRLAKTGDLVEVMFRTDPARGPVRHFYARAQAAECDVDGRPLRLHGTILDITARKRANAAIRQKEERLRAMFELARDGMFTIDESRRVVEANDSFCDMLGYASDEILRRYPWDWDENCATREKHLKTWPELPSAAGTLETRIRRKDGTIFDAEIDYTPLVLAGNRFLFHVCRDVTVVRRQEAELLQGRKMEAVGQLTGGIAHDFNNLLTVINGNLKLLSEDLDDAAGGDARELLADALSAAHDGAELTNRLLAFSRKQALDPKPIDLAVSMESFGRLLRRTLGDNVEFKLEFRTDGSTAFADPGQLEMALLNLAINARNAMQGDGVLTLRSIDRTIGPGAAEGRPDLAPGDYVEIQVADTGCGMSPQVAARAFEPFFTTSSSGEGTGLGLSMVYGFAKQSGGAAWLESTPGRGTTVSILLPRLSTKPAKAAPVDVVSKAPGGSETILVVEDDARVRKFAVRSLERLGYRILEAENAARALEILAGGATVHLVFSDVIMPGGMNGCELAETVSETYPGVKVQLTTGFSKGSTGVVDRCLKDRSILRKPYSREQLATRIRQVLDNEKSPPPAKTVTGGAAARQAGADAARSARKCGRNKPVRKPQTTKVSDFATESD